MTEVNYKDKEWDQVAGHIAAEGEQRVTQCWVRPSCAATNLFSFITTKELRNNAYIVP